MQMAKDDIGDDSISDEREFWFQIDKGWVKEKYWMFDGWDFNILSEDVSKMTYERILKHYSVLGFSNLKKVFVKDLDKSFEEGLYLIDDDLSCKRVLQYIEVLCHEAIEIFIDHDDLPMPKFTPQVLPTKIVNASIDPCERREKDHAEKGEIGMSARDDHGERMDVDMSARVESIDHNERVDEEMHEGLTFHDGVEIPTQCSRVNIQKNTYVNPLGYVSEEDEKDVGDEDVSEDGESEAKDIEMATEESTFTESSQGYFALGMTYANVQEARDAISYNKSAVGEKRYKKKNKKQ